MIDAENDLARLIDEAMQLADDLDLALVGIHLDEARAALASAIGSGRSRSHRSTTNTLIKLLARGAPGEGTVVQLRENASLDQLLAEHEALDARRIALLELTRQTPDTAQVAKQLSEFKALILAHRATERRCVYGPLQRTRISAGNPLDKRINGLTDEMDSDWGQYLDCWNEEKISARWGEFVFATTNMLLRAGDRMRLEERVIYPLAFMSGALEQGTVR